ncbi:hypothetical protein BUALT_Bualt02G0106000 [Buddleja alternifolia]|uniref:Uncharacterized protein n=1 Tax=Buddleja alternifolia TaxID=168488 RepID=A0AAV6Y0R6_9LAMI|nr:hypothetical protein BUALT_Bualt02G0106000 [Buddleja alternifolia]
MSGADEEWVKAAMTDDTMVVELLVHLHAAATPPPSLKPPLDWSVRQRRSRPVSLTNNKYPKKQAQRASPTTPLSWSGATSPSGGSGGSGGTGGGGFEESSRPHTKNLSSITRSKVNGDSEKSTSKRSRKKKTLAELKDDENSLLKERRELKRELAALRTNLEKQRASNEKLKRMKIEFRPLPDREVTSVSPIVPPIISDNNVQLQSSTSNDSPKQNANAPSDSKFVLPDLNMPFEDEARPDVICGVS